MTTPTQLHPAQIFISFTLGVGIMFAVAGTFPMQPHPTELAKARIAAEFTCPRLIQPMIIELERIDK